MGSWVSIRHPYDICRSEYAAKLYGNLSDIVMILEKYKNALLNANKRVHTGRCFDCKQRKKFQQLETLDGKFSARNTMNSL